MNSDSKIQGVASKMGQWYTGQVVYWSSGILVKWYTGQWYTGQVVYGFKNMVTEESNAIRCSTELKDILFDHYDNVPLGCTFILMVARREMFISCGKGDNMRHCDDLHCDDLH